MFNKIIGPLTWVFVIIIGGLMITPEGVNPIVINPVLRMIAGIILLVLGAAGFINLIARK